MGGCCGAMKTGQKSLPEKKPQKADAGEKQKANNKTEIVSDKAAVTEAKPNAAVDAGTIQCKVNGLDEKKVEKLETSVPDDKSKKEEELAAQIVSQAMAAAIAETAATAAGDGVNKEDYEAINEWMKVDTRNELVVSEQILESTADQTAVLSELTPSVPPTSQSEVASSPQPKATDASVPEIPITAEPVSALQTNLSAGDATSENIISNANLESQIQVDGQAGNVLPDETSLAVPEGNVTVSEDIPEEVCEWSPTTASEQPSDQLADLTMSGDPCNSHPIIDQLSSQDHNSEPITDQSSSQDHNSEPITDQSSSQDHNSEPITDQLSSHDQTSEPITEQLTSQYQTSEPIIDQSSSHDQTSELITDQFSSHDQASESITEQLSSHNQTSEPITEQLSSHDQASEPITEQLTSQYQTSEPMIDQSSSHDQTSEPITDQLTSHDQASEPFIEQLSSQDLKESVQAGSPGSEPLVFNQEHNQDDIDLPPPHPSVITHEATSSTTEEPQLEVCDPQVNTELLQQLKTDEIPVLEGVVDDAREQRDLWWAEGSSPDSEFQTNQQESSVVEESEQQAALNLESVQEGSGDAKSSDEAKPNPAAITAEIEQSAASSDTPSSQ